MALPITKTNDPTASTNPTQPINEARLRRRQLEATSQTDRRDDGPGQRCRHLSSSSVLLVSRGGVRSSVGVPARTWVTRSYPLDIGHVLDGTPVAEESQDEQTDPTRFLRSLSSFCLGFVSTRDVVVPR
jgi:hypothetical protein